MVEVQELRVEGLKFKVCDLRFKVHGSGFTVQGLWVVDLPDPEPRNHQQDPQQNPTTEIRFIQHYRRTFLGAERFPRVDNRWHIVCLKLREIAL